MSDNLLEKIYDKVEKLSEDMSEVKVTSAKNTASLEEHMRRSDLLEQHLEVVREEIKPIQAHVNKVTGIAGFIVKGFAILGVAGTIIKLIIVLL